MSNNLSSKKLIQLSDIHKNVYAVCLISILKVAASIESVVGARGEN